MELRQLKYFQKVSRLQSVTKAAEELFVAQPSVTASIHKLEAELGLALFDRSQRNITLTVEGSVFLRRVDEILSRVDDAVAEMNDYRLRQSGAIRVGIPSMIGVFLFPKVFTTFTALYPQYELTVVEEGTISILRLLEQGKLDIGFVVLFDQIKDLEVLQVAKGQMMVCLPPGHPLAELPAVPMSSLHDEPFILLKKGTYNRQMILEQCEKNHFVPNIIFSTSQLETIIGLVEKGVGISFLLDVIARKQHGIVSRPLEEPLFLETGLVWPKGRYMSNAIKAFISFVTASFSAKTLDDVEGDPANEGREESAS